MFDRSALVFLIFATSLAWSGPALAAANDAVPAPEVDAAVAQAISVLLEMQEGETGGEWPYEGVYRVANPDRKSSERSIIPIGYRVGGTSIVASAVFLAPGFSQNPARGEAIERAAAFVCDAIDDPLMSPKYDSGYDVRGWGYIYALDFLLMLEREDGRDLIEWSPDAVPKAIEKKLSKVIGWYLASLQEIEIPESGGWNYARPNGALTQVASTSPFMTGPALQVLFAAKAQGHRVDGKVVDRALDGLVRARNDTGEVVYSSMADKDARGGMLPGSVGRMLVTESTLYLGGRGSLQAVRGAIDAFLVHWEWLDKRRAKDRTHLPPYGVAPYYFYYAHYYAAQAIEQLPEAEREEYRRRLRERLFSVRLDDGTWNDRVFPRTANYGTACSLMALTFKDRSAPARWTK